MESPDLLGSWYLSTYPDCRLYGLLECASGCYKPLKHRLYTIYRRTIQMGHIGGVERARYSPIRGYRQHESGRLYETAFTNEAY